jgi:hypothetical protein
MIVLRNRYPAPHHHARAVQLAEKPRASRGARVSGRQLFLSRLFNVMLIGYCKICRHNRQDVRAAYPLVGPTTVAMCVCSRRLMVHHAILNCGFNRSVCPVFFFYEGSGAAFLRLQRSLRIHPLQIPAQGRRSSDWVSRIIARRRMSSNSGAIFFKSIPYYSVCFLYRLAQNSSLRPEVGSSSGRRYSGCGMSARRDVRTDCRG